MSESAAQEPYDKRERYDGFNQSGPEGRSAATPSLLREFADALDADRGRDKSMVTRVMRTAADDLERCERRLRRRRPRGVGRVAA